MAAVTKCSFEVLPHPPYSPDLAPSLSKSENLLCGRNFGNNETIIDAVDEYLGDQEEAVYFEGINKLDQHNTESALRQREIILRNNGTISALGHSQSTGAKNFFIFPHITTQSTLLRSFMSSSRVNLLIFFLVGIVLLAVKQCICAQ